MSKGKIARGFDADLIVFEPEKTFVVKEDKIQHKHKVTPYLNHELCGVVKQTYLGGVKVYDNGRFTHLNGGMFITG